MLTISVADLLAATSAELVCGDKQAQVSGVTIDSRAVEPGCLFVCFVGERVNGNRFARQAIEAGAGAVALSEAPEEGLVELANAHGCVLLLI